MNPLDKVLSFCGRKSQRLLETSLEDVHDAAVESRDLAHVRESVAEDIAVLEEVALLAGRSPIDPCLRGEIVSHARWHVNLFRELLSMLAEDDGAGAGEEARRIGRVQEDLQAGEWALQWPHDVGRAGFSGQPLLDPAVVGHSTPPQAPGGDDEEP